MSHETGCWWGRDITVGVATHTFCSQSYSREFLTIYINWPERNQIAMMKYYYYGLMDGLHGISGVTGFLAAGKNQGKVL